MTALVTGISLIIAIPTFPIGLLLSFSREKKEERAGEILMVIAVILVIIGGALFPNV